MAEFIAFAKANPGVLNSATQGIGTTSHLTSELFAQMAGVKFQHIHYRGSAPAVQTWSPAMSTWPSTMSARRAR